jgi:hypothetical protein
VRDAASVASAFSTGFAGGDRGLQVLKPEIELVLAQALGLAPEVIAAELTQHVQQALVVTGEPGFLATLGEQHRLQLLDVVGQIVDRICHAEQHVPRARRRQWIILPRVNLSSGSLRCLRCSNAAHVHPRPIEAL